MLFSRSRDQTTAPNLILYLQIEDFPSHTPDLLHAMQPTPVVWSTRDIISILIDILSMLITAAALIESLLYHRRMTRRQ